MRTKKAIIIESGDEFRQWILESVKSALLDILPELKEKSSEMKDYLDIGGASIILKLSKQTIYLNIQSIPHYKTNGRLLFKKAELQRYIETNGKFRNNWGSFQSLT